MLELHDLRPDSESVLENLVTVHPGATLFHHADRLRVFQRTQHLELVPLGIVEHGLVAGALRHVYPCWKAFAERYFP